MISHATPDHTLAEPVRSIDRRPGRWPGEERVTLIVDGIAPAVWGLVNRGRSAGGVRSWADLVVADRAVPADVVDWVGPGRSVMVAYNADETERALRRGVPPAATPAGLALLDAGCRWFKDWYLAEGGREGGTKLQATVPIDASHEQAATAVLVTELEAFLDARAGTGTDRARAELALRVLRPDPAGTS
ncbi:MAG TPA: DUF1122 family protein [Acidimicrobiales bacterium]|nr:DUF1122 family protein [Acidimicrobiales bacterium]